MEERERESCSLSNFQQISLSSEGGTFFVKKKDVGAVASGNGAAATK